MDTYTDDVTRSLDDVSSAVLLLDIPYDEAINMINAHSKFRNVADEKFWKLKLAKDFHATWNSEDPRCAREQYFEIHDLIRGGDSIEDILWSRLRAYETSSRKKVSVHFSGNSDSYHSKFGDLSNALKIAVVSKSETFARASLRLLRFNIDRHNQYDYAAKIMRENKLPLTYTNLIKILANQESGHGSAQPLNDVFTIQYENGDKLTRSITDIDLWNLERLDNHLDIDFRGLS